MDFTNAIALIREFGFPIFVCVWLMRQVVRQQQQVFSVIASVLALMNEVKDRLGELEEAQGLVAEELSEISSGHKELEPPKPFKGKKEKQ